MLDGIKDVENNSAGNKNINRNRIEQVLQVFIFSNEGQKKKKLMHEWTIGEAALGSKQKFGQLIKDGQRF